MKLRRLLAVCIVGAIVASRADAAPIPSDTSTNAGPAIVVQAKSIDELSKTVKTTAKNFLPEALYKEFEKETLSKLDLKVIKGIDPKKPFGFYATLDAGLKDGDFSKSTLVFLVPITDEKDFVALLAQGEIVAEKKGEAYSIPIPNSPIDATMRFIKGYAHIGIAGDKLDPKLLLDPKELFDNKELAAVVVRTRIDRIPAELKDLGLQFMAQAMEKAKEDPIPPEAKGLLESYLKMSMRWMKLGINEGKELVYRLDLDSKTGAIVIEATLDGKPDSSLAKSIAGIKPSKNDFAGLIGSDSAAHALFQTPLFVEDLQNILVELIDLGAREAEKNIAPADEKKREKEMAAEAFKALKRTVKSGDLDLAASLRGPDKNDRYTAVGAFSLKETASLEKAVKAALKTFKHPERVKADSYRVGEINIHEVMSADELPPEAQNIFGKSNVHLAFAPDAVFVTFGARAKELMKEGLTAKLGPKPAPLAHFEVSGKRLMPLIKSAGAPMDGPAGQFIEQFSKIDRLPVFSLKVEGGDKLVMREEIGTLPILWLFRYAAAEGVGGNAKPPAIAPPVPNPK